MSKRISRTVSAFCVGLFLAAASCTPALAQLPFDPSSIDQLTPEQRQKAIDALGGGSSGGLAAPDGRFRDQQLSAPSAVIGTPGGTDRLTQPGAGVPALITTPGNPLIGSPPGQVTPVLPPVPKPVEYGDTADEPSAEVAFT